MQAKSDPPLESVNRTLSIVELIAADGALSATSLASKLGISRAAAFRIAQSLTLRAWLTQNADKTYRLGPALQSMATTSASDQYLLSAMRPFMDDMHRTTNETIHLTRLAGRHVVYLEQIVSPQPVRSVSVLGGRSPAHGVSPGLAQLAYLPQDQLKWFLANPLPGFTSTTITSSEELVSTLAEVRERGYAVNVGGYRSEVGGVGAAVIDSQTGEALAALSICSPTYRLSPEAILNYGRIVKKTVAEAAKALKGAVE
jgi:DNA-binding IclR family transcriptional regulator